MKIFVTGATGCLGRRVVERLMKEGHELPLLVRSIPEVPLYHQPNIQLVKGDVTNVASYEGDLSGQDVLIHLAAPVVYWRDWSLYHTGIVQATEELYAAANRQGVGRFLYISSESVLQDREDLLDIDEHHPYPKEPSSYYGRAKKMAEQLLMEAMDQTEVLILRPTFIWGPGVAALDTFVEKVETGQFIWIDKGQVMVEMVHVDNVAEAIALATVKGRSGEIYFVTDGQFWVYFTLFSRWEIEEMFATCLYFQNPKLPLDIISRHYSNSIFLLLDRIFLQQKHLTKEEALASLNLLLLSFL